MTLPARQIPSSKASGAKTKKTTARSTASGRVAQRKTAAKKTGRGGSLAATRTEWERLGDETVRAAAEARYVPLQERGNLTIPADLRRALHLDQPGAMAKLTIRPDGVLEIRPQVPVAAEQAWFWTDRWQQMEHDADADIAAGRVIRYDDADDFLASLEAL